MTIEWPDAQDEPKILAYKKLRDSGRLDEFVGLVSEGGAVDQKSVQDKLKSTHKVAYIERGKKMVAVAALKRRRPAYAEAFSRKNKSGYALSGDIPELGYVAVSCDWRGLHLSSKVVKKILAEFGSGKLFATTSDPKMKGLLTKHDFRQVGQEWRSKRPGEHLSLWIRGQGL